MTESDAGGGEATAPVREPVDLRLAVGALTAWGAVFVCVHSSTLVALTAGVACATVGALLLTVGRRARAAPACALAVLCASLALLPLAGRIAHATAGPLHRLAARGAAVSLTMTATGDPATLSASGPSGLPRVLVPGAADSVRWAGASVPGGGRVLVLGAASAWRGVLPGQRLIVDGTLAPDAADGALSTTLFARSPPTLLGRPPWWQRAAGVVRSALRSASAPLPGDVRGLLPGLVDGDTANLDPVLAAHFRAAGLTHLVAVSGTNCSLVLGAVLLALRRTRARPWLRAVVGAGVLVVFVLVARPSPSVLRAAAMAAVALFSLATGRPSAAVPSLAAVTLGLLLWDPTLADSASFAMSVLATAALLVVAPGWAAALRARRVPAGVAEAVAVAAAAHVVTAPVAAAISGRFSVLAVPANVLAEPVVAVTTVLGFGAALLAPLWLPGGVAMAWLAGWPCRWLVRVADVFGSPHIAVVPWPSGATGAVLLAAALGCVVVAARRVGARRALVAAALTAAVVALPVRAVTSTWPPPGWIFTACDVGQGDGLVLNAGAGAAVEIDAGPDPVLADRCLRDLHIDRLPLLVLTHFHLDHVGGIVGAVRGRQVGAVLAGPLAEPAEGVDLVRRVLAPRGLTVRVPAPGAQLTVGPVRLDVLGPAEAFHGTRSDPNNSSLVIRATVAGVRLLLAGDAEIEAQQALLRAGVDLRADVLKVAHHGSAYFDPAFLAAVHARLAVVSVGLHNRYGHPAPSLLRAVGNLGVPLLRTDRDGDVAVTAVDGRLGAVIHGVRASGTTAAGPDLIDDPPTGADASRSGGLDAASTGAAPRTATRVAARRRVPSTSTTCPTHYPVSCCSSATSNSWSTSQSARSPPPTGASTILAVLIAP